MKIRYLLGALALTMSTASFAADPVPEPKKESCCCKKGEDGKMACCKDKVADKDHSEHGMGGMDHK